MNIVEDPENDTYYDSFQTNEFNYQDDGIQYESEKTPTLSQKLLYFFLVFNISVRVMNYLLNLMAEEGMNVPRTVYLLKKMANYSPQKVQILRTTAGHHGEFAYISIKENLLYCLSNKLLHFKSLFNDIKISINIDGLPLFKSSPVQAWPILMTIRDFSFKKPLPIGIYVGYAKPNLHSFIQYLHSELVEFKDYVTLSNVNIKIVDILFVCDAPARAFLQCVKGHSGYNGCPYCRIKGDYSHLHHKVIFPFSSNFVARQDNLYSSFSENNQLSLSPLFDICSLKSSFPPEYMHLVCLGVMKRLMHCYLSTNFGRQPCFLSNSAKSQLNERVNAFKGVLPFEFKRKVRSLDHLVYFKATEYRTLLLYTGPILLKDILDPQYYNHFLLLHFGISVYANPNLSHFYDQAEACIKLFCSKISEYFGEGGFTYNSHCLLHLSDFVRLLGPLDSFSSFPFENHLYLLKQRIKNGNFLLSQSVNSLKAIRDVYSTLPDCSLYFSNDFPNNCALIVRNDSFVPLRVTKVRQLNDKQVLHGFLFKFLSDFYDYPYRSSSIGIGIYKLSDNFVIDVVATSKCVCFPFKDTFCIVPYVCSTSEQ